MEPVTSIQQKAAKEGKGAAYCPICTHVVDTPVLISGKRMYVKPGQKCPRCSSSLEAASVVRYDVAA